MTDAVPGKGIHLPLLTWHRAMPGIQIRGCGIAPQSAGDLLALAEPLLSAVFLLLLIGSPTLPSKPDPSLPGWGVRRQRALWLRRQAEAVWILGTAGGRRETALAVAPALHPRLYKEATAITGPGLQAAVASGDFPSRHEAADRRVRGEIDLLGVGGGSGPTTRRSSAAYRQYCYWLLFQRCRSFLSGVLAGGQGYHAEHQKHHFGGIIQVLTRRSTPGGTEHRVHRCGVLGTPVFHHTWLRPITHH